MLTVNLLTWRKVSPVFYWKTEPFIPAHDKCQIALLIIIFAKGATKIISNFFMIL